MDIVLAALCGFLMDLALGVQPVGITTIYLFYICL